MTAPEVKERGAIIDPSGVYRYRLWRKWADGPVATFIMLNPSIANAEKDDPTIRRCLGFARSWGCGALEVVNLYALRSTNPEDLDGGFVDPVGPRNDEFLRLALVEPGPKVAAWGTHPMAVQRAAHVSEMAKAVGAVVGCLGLTKAGHPRHPLYAPGHLVPRPFPWPPRGDVYASGPEPFTVDPHRNVEELGEAGA